ncbi:MAG: aspartyl-tRNA(Asn)/glutamyl-tRNA(Gln) amidotransferase subunit [Patescibacteria group bacterium]|nr:aspartyl-tRNA(Asn)/glutamyl-tRNA(Gln) amidotransferase subunit [Patescibacteria group bacterium]
MPSLIKEINSKILNKETTIENIVNEYLNTLKSKDSSINSMLEIYSDEYIKEQIKIAEKMLEENKTTLLTGVPVVVKDNLCVKNQLTTAASKMLANYKATYDATVIQKLKDAGAIIVGRSNMDEFAMGGSTENSAFMQTKNPLDISRVPGGSSGGSAAAVAMGGVPVSLGSDTGGSIRQPASFTGIIGLKPTYGAVSRYGLIAMGSSLDCVGPFANNIEDIKIIFDIIKGEDARDATTIKNQELELINKNLSQNKNRKIIGIPKKFIDQDGVDSNIRDNFYKTIEQLKKFGWEIKEIELKNIEKALSVYYILMFAEVSSNLARFDGVRYGESIKGATPEKSMILSRSEGLGEEPTRRSLLGTYVLSSGYYDSYYGKAIAARDYLKDEFKKIFQEVDLVATPTSPVFPWKFGEKNDPLAMYLADIFTVPANIVGIPGISLPTGKVNVEELKNLSFGTQFLAEWHNEEKLFTVAEDLGL